MNIVNHDLLLKIIEMYPFLVVGSITKKRNMYFLDRNAVIFIKNYFQSGCVLKSTNRDKERYDTLKNLDLKSNTISLIICTFEWINPYTSTSEHNNKEEMKKEFDYVRRFFSLAYVDTDFMKNSAMQLYGTHMSTGFDNQLNFLKKISETLCEKKSMKNFMQYYRTICETAKLCNMQISHPVVMTSILCLAQCEHAISVCKFKQKYSDVDAYNALSDISMVVHFSLLKHIMLTENCELWNDVGIVSFDHGLIGFFKILDSANISVDDVKYIPKKDEHMASWRSNIPDREYFSKLSDKNFSEFSKHYYGSQPSHTPTAPHS